MNDFCISANDARKIADTFNDDSIQTRNAIFTSIRNHAAAGKYSCNTVAYRKCTKVQAEGLVELLKSFGYEASYGTDINGVICFQISWSGAYVKDER